MKTRREFLLLLGAFSRPGIGRGAGVTTGKGQDCATTLVFDGNARTLRVMAGGTQVRHMLDMAKVKEYQALVQAPPLRDRIGELDSLSRALYETLWKPVEDSCADVSNIVIRASGVLRNFPFESLRGPRGYVGQRSKIRYAWGRRGSGSDRDSGQPRTASFIYAPMSGVRSPLGGLPSARREAKLVSRVLGGELRLGADATCARLEQDAAEGFSVLHLATHCRLNASQVPSLAMRASGGGRIEYLSAADVGRMRLPGHLVVLSACGPQGKVMELGDAFLRAGAREVVASRWAVDDEAGFVFMREFYEEIAGTHDTARALRHARAMMITSEFVPYRNPYYWGNFVCLSKAAVTV